MSDDQITDRRSTRVSELVERFGNDTHAIIRLAERIASLEHDNYREREQHRATRAELEALRERVPAEGSVVLSAEEARTYQAYRELGDLAEVRRRMRDSESLAQENATLRREQVLRRAAEVHGYVPTVLSRLPGFDHQVEVRVETDGDQQVERAYVAIDETTQVPLETYVREHYAEFLPALLVQREPPAPTGTPYIPQQSGTSQPAQPTIDELVRRKRHQYGGI